MLNVWYIVLIEINFTFYFFSMPPKKTPPASLNQVNQKLDKLLSYHHSMRRWAWIKGILWVVLFVILVVLPSYYGYKYINQFLGANSPGISNSVSGSGGSNPLGQLNDIQGLLDNINQVQKLINQQK